jgi:hypothetical protein
MDMMDADLLWHWLHTDNNQSSVLRLLSMLMAVTLGATLASLVTWIEGHLTFEEE